MQDIVQYNEVAQRTLLTAELPPQSAETIVDGVIGKLAKGVKFFLYVTVSYRSNEPCFEFSTWLLLAGRIVLMQTCWRNEMCVTAGVQLCRTGQSERARGCVCCSLGNTAARTSANALPPPRSLGELPLCNVRYACTDSSRSSVFCQ